MQQLEWSIEKRKVSELKNWDKNPRKITATAFEKLKDRIRKRGFHDVIKIDTDGVILSGNQRRKALLDLGFTDVEVKVPNRPLTEQEKQEIALESNRNDGVWDNDLLANFDEMILLEVGFDSKELDNIFDIKSKDDDFDIEKALAEASEPKAKYGDVYLLGQHRLVCGDATKKEDIDKLMDGKKAQMVFTDPPYNIDYKGGMNGKSKNSREGIMNDKMNKIDFKDFLLKSCQRMLENCEGGGIHLYELQRTGHFEISL